jgi:hypothetical protein
MIIREFTEQKSRTYHFCNVCNSIIPCGELYKRHYTRGEAQAMKMHNECYRKELLKEYEWETIGRWQKQ